MAKEFILSERVLSDNVLLVPEEGKVFKGGYVGIVKEFVFASAWSDREVVKRFRSYDRLKEYVGRVYSDFDLSQI